MQSVTNNITINKKVDKIKKSWGNFLRIQLSFRSFSSFSYFFYFSLNSQF